MKTYIFGYGSLMNKGSLQKTLPGARIEKRATLLGYQRKFNFAVGQFVYLNIIPKQKMSVEGVLIPVNENELKKLKQREKGYKCKNVSKLIPGPAGSKVFAFIGPDREYSDKKILKSYLHTCLGGVPRPKRKKWIADTIMKEVENDLLRPKYKNRSL